MDVVEKRVQTFVRVKPTASFAQDVIKFGADKKSIEICIKKDAKRGIVNNQRTEWSFRLDGVLHNTSQEVTYETVARKLVSEALIGYNGTIMCYGQTGAGKTYTMTGDTREYRRRGIIPRAIQEVFKSAAHSIDPFITVRISYLEIYNEALADLLSTVGRSGTGDVSLAIGDGPQGVFIKGLSVHSVRDEEEALSLLFEGETNRVIAEHTLNKNSSRSHCIFTIYIESRFRAFSDVKCIRSKINLIDLAGSERLSKTGSEGQVLRETTYINKSLSFLEQIILALGDPKRDHIPFRQSKLTHILRDSLGGNCNTVLVANICGEAAHVEETLSSLRFATRMRCVPTKAVVNETIDQEETIKALEKEILLLKQELATRDFLVSGSSGTPDPLSDVQVAQIKSQVHRFLKGTIEDIDILSVRQVQEVFRQFKLILRHQEQEVEERLRQKYALRDQSDFGAVEKAGVGDHSMWEEEGRDLGTRTTPSSSRHVEKKKSRKMDEQEPSQVVPSTKDLEVEQGARDQDAANADGEVSEPPPVEDSQWSRSFPPKEVAFEQFKEEQGKEINRIFKENKSILLARKKRSSEVAQRVNVIQREIEDIKKALEAQKQERWQQGEHVDEKGHVIVDEEEFLLMVKLKDLKEDYRSGYAELKDLKAELQYCQGLVNQCRQKLISEFEMWYNESFLIPKELQEALKPRGDIRPGMIPIERVMDLEEDDQERFQKMQEKTLPFCPASAAFYRARMKNDLQRSYARTMRSLEQMQKKPGLMKAAGKNKALSFLHVT